MRKRGMHAATRTWTPKSTKRKFNDKGFEVNFRGFLIVVLKVVLIMGLASSTWTQRRGNTTDDHYLPAGADLDNFNIHDDFNLYLGQRIGEAANPGPEPDGAMCIECANVTHLYNTRNMLKDRMADFIFGQEHSFLIKDWPKTRRELRPWRVHLSGLDEEAENPIGGYLCNET